MDYNAPGSSVHGISQARTLEWVAISFSRGSSQPRDWICLSCIGRQVVYHWATWEALFNIVCVCYTSLCLTLRDPLDSSLPGSSVYGISQARTLEWVAMYSPVDLPSPGIEPVSPALSGRFFTTEPPGKPNNDIKLCKSGRSEDQGFLIEALRTML